MLQKGRSEDARKSLKDLIDSELLQTIDNNVRIGHLTLSSEKTPPISFLRVTQYQSD